MQQFVDSVLGGLMNSVMNGGPVANAFAMEVKRNPNNYDGMMKEVLTNLDKFSSFRLTDNQIKELVNMCCEAAISALFRSFANNINGASPNQFEKTLYDALDPTLQNIKGIHAELSRTSSGGWGSSNINSGWGSGSTTTSAFGNGASVGGGFGSMSSSSSGSGSLLSSVKVPVDEPTPAFSSAFGKPEVTETNKPVEEKIMLSYKLSPINYVPYNLAGVSVTAVDSDGDFITVTRTEAKEMRMNYFDHELNKAFALDLKDGKLNAQKHNDTTSLLNSVVMSEIDVNKIEESIPADATPEVIGKAFLDAGLMANLQDHFIILNNEETVHSLDPLSAQLEEINNRLQEHDVSMFKNMVEFYTLTGVAFNNIKPFLTEIEAVTKATSIFGAGKALEFLSTIRECDYVARYLNKELTRTVNKLLTSLFPIMGNTPSFLSDYKAIHEVVVKKIEGLNIDPEVKQNIETNIMAYLRREVGTWFFASETNEVILTYELRICSLPIKSTDLGLSLPRFIKDDGTDAIHQLSGGLVDEDIHPELFSFLNAVYNRNKEKRTIFVTTDLKTMSLDRALDNVNGFFLGLPEDIDVR